MEYVIIFLHVCSGTISLQFTCVSIMCGNALFVGVVNAFESVVFMHYV